MNVTKTLQLGIFVLFLAGCNPFNERTNKTETLITEAESNAKSITNNYKSEIRKVKPYQVYQYQTELKDPFRVRQFLLQEQRKAEKEQIENRCLPPRCIPPVPHETELLENYSLNQLIFTGTLGKNNDIALIKTPDYGIVSARIGDYIGQNNGKIQTINETSVVLQEKIHKNGLWENKKTILVITQ